MPAVRKASICSSVRTIAMSRRARAWWWIFGSEVVATCGRGIVYLQVFRGTKADGMLLCRCRRRCCQVGVTEYRRLPIERPKCGSSKALRWMKLPAGGPSSLTAASRRSPTVTCRVPLTTCCQTLSWLMSRPINSQSNDQHFSRTCALTTLYRIWKRSRPNPSV